MIKSLLSFIILLFALYTLVATSQMKKIRSGMFNLLSDCPDATIESAEVYVNFPRNYSLSNQDEPNFVDFIADAINYGFPSDSFYESNPVWISESDTRICRGVWSEYADDFIAFLCENKDTNQIECTISLTRI